MADDHVQFHSAPEQWAKLKAPAQRMRQHPTSAEAVLWEHLRNRQLEGTKFRRQHPIGHFVVDFFCWSAKLVIEIDGEIHNQQRDADDARQAYIEAQGFRVIRFKNQAIFDSLESVLQNIAAYVSSARNAPSPNGEGVGG
jgi:very-short-patch-repair endonuclease